MKFDVVAFLDAYSIEYITTGRNVKAGNVNVKCPFCGSTDPSQHMGIRLDGRKYGCWRNSSHRGKHIERLISALVGCSLKEAKSIIEEGVRPDTPWAELRDRVARLRGEEDAQERPGATIPPETTLPRGVRPIAPQGPTRKFFRYLRTRGFRKRDIELLCERYKLRCGLFGKWSGRLLFPFVYKGKVRGWTARAISDKAKIKYMSEPPGDLAKATVFNYDRAVRGGKILVICEGPLDCLKIDFYTPGVRAVCLLGLSATPSQMRQLLRLAAKYERVVLLPDTEAVSAGIRLQSELAVINPEMGHLPDGIEDPGKLTPREAYSLVF